MTWRAMIVETNGTWAGLEKICEIINLVAGGTSGLVRF